MDLFDNNKNIKRKEPLALKFIPKTLEEFVGQEHILGSGKLLKRAIESDKLSSVIFHGPSGSGKSSLVKIIANRTSAYFQEINAVISGVEDLRKTVAAAENREKKTILLVDEIHHFNKSQQDALLPDVEKGVISLIGITTENPFFYINSALISRSQVFQFKALSNEEIKKIVVNSLRNTDLGFSGIEINIKDDALDHIIKYSEGDAR